MIDGYNAADNGAKCYALAIETMRAKLESFHKVQIGDCTLYRADCRDVLPLLPKVDALVTDPPYGIGADKGKQTSRTISGKGSIPFKGSKPIPVAHYPYNKWDDNRPSLTILDGMRKISSTQIIWGGNYFADLLPAQGCWLWWDKCQTMPSFGDGELAWTNLAALTPRKFTLANNKLTAQRVQRHHPTQKPLTLMKWCIERLPDNAKTILDPFMGSGTTGVACVKLGRKFIGVEIDESYFDIACRRIAKAYEQPDLFVASPGPQAEQLTMLEADA